MKVYPAYKDSHVEWIGEIPEHWHKVRLKFVCAVKARLGWRGLKASEYVDDGYIFISTPNIKGETIDFDNVNYISKERFDESPEIILEEGYVLLAKDGSTLGTTNVVRELPRPATVNSSIAVLKPSRDVDGVFLYYYLSSTYIQNHIAQIKDGMGVPHLFQDDIREFWLLIPSEIEEQRRISEFLDCKTVQIDTLIEKKQRQIDLLQEQCTALINYSVTKGLNPDVTMKDSGVEWLGDVPSHWEVMMLKWIAYLQRGHDLPSDNRVDGEFPIVSSAGISGYHNECKAQGPGVVTGRYGTIGVVHFVDQDYWPLNTTLYVKDFCGNHARFIFYLLKILPFKAFSEKSAVPGVDRKDLHELMLGCPPVSEQETIANYLDETNEKISQAENKIKQEIALLQEYRKALISEAVTGKIDVREWRPDRFGMGMRQSNSF